MSVPCFWSASDAQMRKLIESVLMTDAARTLPPGSVYEIRGDMKRTGIAWYYLPRMVFLPLVDLISHRDAKEADLGGYLFLGRLKTPERA